MKKIISFRRIKATKKDNEDAECSGCRTGVHAKDYPEGTKYWYIFGGENHGGIQLCQSCFDRLENEKEMLSNLEKKIEKQKIELLECKDIRFSAKVAYRDGLDFAMELIEKMKKGEVEK